MYRRHILSVIAATVLAGCGWSQETRDLEEASGNPAPDETPDENGDEDEQTPEPLPTITPGETLIEADGEELLLPTEAVIGEDGWAEIDGWQENEIITTNPCQEFEKFGREETMRTCRICVIVADDEAGAIDEFETFADISSKKQLDRTRTFLEEKNIEANIGNEATIHTAKQEIGRQSEKQLATRSRLVFRDKNAVGTIDYSERTWAATEYELREYPDIVDLAVKMHSRWPDR